MTWRARAVFIAVALEAYVITTRSARADAEMIEHCASSAESAQALRKRGRLLEARTKVRACGIASCPRVVRDDCASWAGQIEAALPSVVFAVKDQDGEDITDVSISVDGKVVADRVSGLAIDLDPGDHLFRFTRADGTSFERKLVVREGEKRRVVEVRFAPKQAPSAEKREPETGDAARSRSSSLPWILGGVGVASLAGFAVLGLTGLDRYHSLHDECGRIRTCSDDEISRNRTQMWFANGLGVVGVVALGAAVWLFVDGMSRPEPRVVGPTPRGRGRSWLAPTW